MAITPEATDRLFEDLCREVNVPFEKPSASLLVQLFTAVTAIKLPADLTPPEQLSKLVSILGDEVVHAPLDHINAADLTSGDTEALHDLLEILSTCLHLRDDSVTSASDEMTTAESCQTSLHSAMSSLASSKTSSSSCTSSSSSSDSLYSSESSCSTCDSASGTSSLSRSTMFSEATQEIEFGCRLCLYLSNHDPSRSSRTGANAGEIGEEETAPTNRSVVDEVPSTQEFVPPPSQPPSHVRPSKAQRMKEDAAAVVGQRLDARRGLRTNALAASNKLRQSKPITRDPLPRRTSFPIHKKNVIKTRTVGLKAGKMPPPENGLENQPDGAAGEQVEEMAIDESRISPHLVRVLKKQYNQHLLWMKSHGLSESGFKKLERDYEELIENHTARVKQMRVEAASQNRISLLKAQKGITQTVRNLQTHAKSQATQLAHVQLEAERLQRSKEAKMRLAEEKLLRETFVEAMRIQKEQLLSLKRDLADERYREADKHKIYMQGLDHFYRTQLDMLAEALDKEHKNGELRNSAQMALLRGMRKELKEKLDKEVAFLKDLIASEPDP